MRRLLKVAHSRVKAELDKERADKAAKKHGPKGTRNSETDGTFPNFSPRPRSGEGGTLVSPARQRWVKRRNESRAPLKGRHAYCDGVSRVAHLLTLLSTTGGGAGCLQRSGRVFAVVRACELRDSGARAHAFCEACRPHQTGLSPGAKFFRPLKRAPIDARQGWPTLSR